MKTLFVTKTASGSRWAALQARELVKQEIEVHAVVPDANGTTVPFWRTTGAVLHFEDLNLPLTRPWKLPSALHRVRKLVAAVKPDIIHTHHVSTTLAIRLALGTHHSVPRVFQVPGPLHLEHGPYRRGELGIAGPNDFWIGSSRYITDLYRRFNIRADRLFLSYYGHEVEQYATDRTEILRRALGIAPHQIVVGNINLIYPPKYHVGQTIGLKCHEDVISALGIVTKLRPDVTGVLVGGTFGRDNGYEAKLKARAERVGAGRILMPGYLPLEVVTQAWPDFDLGVHVPMSENCGGVVEPLLAGVPVIASRVGGLPEAVIAGCTGTLVGVRRPDELASAILAALDNYEQHKRMALNGRELMRHMFDVRRTGLEVAGIYRHIINGGEPQISSFDSFEYCRRRLDLATCIQ